MPKHKKHAVPNGRALSELENMRHKDLQRAVVVRGMPFEKVVASTTTYLAGWFQNHFIDTCHPQLLNDFDEWREAEIRRVHEESGREIPGGMLHPQLRLGYIGEEDPETGEVKIKRIKGVKKPKKVKRQRDASTGLFKGTKKDYTFTLTHAGEPILSILKLVKEKFPEAVDKSIKIWHKRALKAKQPVK